MEMALALPRFPFHLCTDSDFSHGFTLPGRSNPSARLHGLPRDATATNLDEVAARRLARGDSHCGGSRVATYQSVKGKTKESCL